MAEADDDSITITIPKAALREVLERLEKIERILSGKDKEGSPHALRAVLNRSLSKEPPHAKSYLGVDLEEVVTRILAEKKQKEEAKGESLGGEQHKASANKLMAQV